METRRFDELTVALARGGSRRNVLRGLVGSVLGALALDGSGALAKDKTKENGGGKPITILAKPRCTPGTVQDDCPLCAEARTVCCNAEVGDKACGPNYDDAAGNPLPSCATANQACVTEASPNGSCVRAKCTADRASGVQRCEYTKINNSCPNKGVCCNDFTSASFGTCVSSRSEC
jgi:hypothetical protein